MYIYMYTHTHAHKGCMFKSSIGLRRPLLALEFVGFIGSSRIFQYTLHEEYSSISDYLIMLLGVSLIWCIG